MPVIRCSEMDGFAHKLLEARRRREGLVIRDHAAIELTYVCVDIARLHQEMSDHRYNCAICREAEVVPKASNGTLGRNIELAAANAKSLTDSTRPTISSRT